MTDFYIIANIVRYSQLGLFDKIFGYPKEDRDSNILVTSSALQCSLRNTTSISCSLYPRIHPQFLEQLAGGGLVKTRRNTCMEWKKKKKIYGPFSWMGLNCPRATESLREGSLLFTTKFPEIPGTHFIDLGRWKAESTLEPPSGFEHETPGLGIQHLNQWVQYNLRCVARFGTISTT